MIRAAQQLRFTKLYLNKPQDFWNTKRQTDGAKVELMTLTPSATSCKNPNNIYFLPQKHLTPTVKHGSREVIIWACLCNSSVICSTPANQHHNG